MTSTTTNHRPPPLHVIPPQHSPRVSVTFSTGVKKLKSPRLLHFSYGAIRAVDRVLAWDDKPCEILPNGKKSYLDQQDVVTFLDPPKELIPLDQASYNSASYLWKKIEDVTEERRGRLLSLINPRKCDWNC